MIVVVPLQNSTWNERLPYIIMAANFHGESNPRGENIYYPA
jgi:hypothetical protein